MIEVSLLGPPRVERDGRRVAFETRKAVALLAVLALAGRPRTRDALADLLWPDQDPERGRGALRRTLSDLRSGVGPQVLEADHDQVALVTGPHLTVDVSRFRELSAQGRHQQAVELFRGEFLEGLAVRAAPAFEEWVEVEHDALRRELVAALAALTQAREEAADLGAAVDVARRWVDVDPLHEPAHRALIRLYAATGDRAAALDQYRRCARTLSEELGVDPLPETTELVEAVRRGDVAPVRRTAPAAAPRSPVLVTPFVGRAEQLAAALTVYERIGSDAHVVLVDGEPGIGKTRFAEELLSVVRRNGGAVVAGRAYEEEAGLAYGPVSEALRGALGGAADWRGSVREASLAEAARLVPELEVAGSARTLAPDHGPGAEARFLTGLWDTVVAAAASGEATGAVFIDDIQWCDEASVAFLGFAMRRLVGRPVLLLLAGRTPLGHPLRRGVGVLSRSGTGAVVALDRLDPDEVALLARAAGREDPAVAHRLWERTEGVPLLLVEYLQSGADADELPDSVRDLLRTRLEPLSAAGRQILSAAAVLGRSFDVSTLRSVSGRTDEETVTALEETARLGLVTEGPADYDFAHDLVRALVYEDTSLARRRLLHGRAAEVPGTPAVSRARHLQLGGRPQDAARAFRVAAEQARSVYAHAEAVEHYRAALGLGHPARVELSLAIGDLLMLTGDYASALRAFEAAGAEPGAGGRAAVDERLGRLALRTGEYAAAQAHLDAALRGVPVTEPGRRAEILADLSLTAQSRGDAPRARRLAEQADELATEAADRRARCRTQNLLGVLATEQDDVGAALPKLRRACELAEELGDVDLRVAATNNLALAHRRAGDLDRALDLTRRSLALCATSGDRHQEAALRNNLADLLHASGDAEEAMAQLKIAVAIFAEIGQEDAPRPGVWKLTRW